LLNLIGKKSGLAGKKKKARENRRKETSRLEGERIVGFVGGGG